MRALSNIGVAFVCMNLPYKMDVQQAVQVVLAFKPRMVHPYHCRGKKGLSNAAAFQKKGQSANKKAEVCSGPGTDC